MGANFERFHCLSQAFERSPEKEARYLLRSTVYASPDPRVGVMYPLSACAKRLAPTVSLKRDPGGLSVDGTKPFRKGRAQAARVERYYRSLLRRRAGIKSSSESRSSTDCDPDSDVSTPFLSLTLQRTRIQVFVGIPVASSSVATLLG
jgi:hypothetical protein